MNRNQELQFDVPQGPITYEQWMLHSVGQQFAEEIEVAKNRGYRPTDGQTKLVTDGGQVKHSDTNPSWMAQGGSGLPEADETDKHGRVWLFSCSSCGTRWANPPAPPAQCSCGSKDIVCHKFEHQEYINIRYHGTPQGRQSTGDGE